MNDRVATDERWWARRLWKLPTWAWVIAAIVVIGAIGAAAGGGSGDDETATESPATAVTTVLPPTIAETATARSVDETSTIPTTAPAAPSDADVPWENYDDLVRQRINDLAATGDCAGLQGEFDTADANNDIQRNRTGTGNTELMGYLDDLMRAAGCY